MKNLTLLSVNFVKDLWLVIWTAWPDELDNLKNPRGL